MNKLQSVAGMALVAASLAGTGCYVRTYGRGYAPVYTTSATVQTQPVMVNGGVAVNGGVYSNTPPDGVVYANGGGYVQNGGYVQAGGVSQGTVAWGMPPTAVVVQAPPPMAQVNTAGPMGMGAQGQVWVDGHYEWQGSNYVWVNGMWSNPPQPGFVWQQPAYVGNQWYQGYWRAQNVQVPEVYLNGNGRWNAGFNAGVSLGANVGGTVVNTTTMGGGGTVRVNGGGVSVGVGVGVAPPVLPRKR